MQGDVPNGWTRTRVADLLSESEEQGSTGLTAQKLTVKLYGKGVVAKVDRAPGSENTRYFRRRAGQFIYSRLDFLNGAFAIIPPELDGRESTADLPAFDMRPTVHPAWFLYFVSRPDFYERYGSAAIGSRKARRVSPEELLALELPLPPLPEQKKIAAILSSVDEAIQATQAVIDQTRRVKEGLLQDLLTRGMPGHRRFKQTEIGEIPEGWEIRRVEDLLAPVDPAMRSGPFGSALLKSELVESGVPVLGIDNVHVECFVADYRRFITPEKFEALRRYAVRPDDVMITIMGTVGRCCVVPRDIGTAISSKHTWTLTFDPQKCRPYLMCAQFNFAPWILRHFKVDGQGGMMDAIRSDTLRNAAVPVPPLAEQVEIERVLTAVDAQRKDHEFALEHLTKAKSGLLQDLLTGRVRVTP